MSFCALSFLHPVGNSKHGWVDAVNPSGDACSDAGCEDKFQTQAGTPISYDGSFAMINANQGKTCVRFMRDRAQLREADCANSQMRPICRCTSIEKPLYFKFSV